MGELNYMDHHGTDGAVCPWCGHDNGDIAAEAAEYDGFDCECLRCEKEFSHTLEMSYAYHTEKKPGAK